MLVAIQLFVPGLYLPPVFKKTWSSHPPQMIISLPVQTAMCYVSTRGALVVLVAVQLSVPGLYLPPVFKAKLPDKSAPDDHLATGPDCRVLVLGLGRVGGAGRGPTIRAWIVSPARVQIGAGVSSPDDHLAAGPDCRMNPVGHRARWWCWWLSNCPCRDCISRRCSKSCCHYIRPRRSFHCQSTLPCGLSGHRARWWCWWLSNCPCWDCISRRCSNR